MGYEVKYLYHNKNDEGSGYDRENTEEIVKQIGDPFEDVPLEKLAAAILMQMARRDIWVVDVKITELKKQEIAFKESTDGDGIILKNKKFTLDSIAGALMQSQISQPIHPQQYAQPRQPLGIGAEIPGQPAPPPPQMQPPQRDIQVPAELQNMQVKKVEIFDPEPDMVKAGMIKGRLTPGKRYPIFEEMRDPREGQAGRQLPILYVTIDDTGKRVVVPEPCFRPPGAGLIGGNFQAQPQTAIRGDGLSWDGVIGNNDNIDIRSGRRLR